KVKAHNSNYLLFLKHYSPDWMPPTYRDGILFLSDSQEYPSFDRFLNETDPSTAWGVGYKTWAKTFETGICGMQYGYESDQKSWWNKLKDPQKAIGDSCLYGTKNTQFLFWVDFTVNEVDWNFIPDDNQSIKLVSKKNLPMKIFYNDDHIRIIPTTANSPRYISTSLFDMRGKMVMKKDFNLKTSGEMVLTPAVAKGYYTLTIVTDDYNSTSPLLIP
ncbi:MAG: hypothetical protein JW795_10575, partial [Chitinivibrionales bacterium]|nr:hypothetical protein [Chitinivibrionales bacterium]